MQPVSVLYNTVWQERRTQNFGHFHCLRAAVGTYIERTLKAPLIVHDTTR